MKKLLAAINVLRAGQVVANPALLKNATGLGQAIAALITALLLLAGAFGHEIALSEEAVYGLGIGLGALIVGMYGTYASSDKVGFGPKPQPPADLPAADPPAAAPYEPPVSGA